MAGRAASGPPFADGWKAVLFLGALLAAAGLAEGGLAAQGTSRAPATCEEVAAATTRGGARLPEAAAGGLGCSTVPRATDDGLYLVDRVIDGDTIVLANGERVRYVGIDAPEERPTPEPFAREATALNRRLVEARQVRLLMGRTDRDRYGRLLRYVMVEGILVEAELVREGLARAREYEPGQPFARCQAALEQEARAERRGLWAAN